MTAPISLPNNPRPKVLLIDNSPDDLKPLLILAPTEHMRFVSAFSGQDGLDKAMLHQPDLIIMEVNLPDMDGFATCRRLKAHKRTKQIPVIFLTGANDLDSRLEGFALGATDYIGKPYSEHEVLARMLVHLELTMNRMRGVLVDTRASANEAQKTARPEIERRRDVLLRSACAYLNHHLSDPPPPATLARLIGTNEKRLNQAFNDHFGMPVFAWLREERMRQARELLIMDHMTVASISDYLGFSTPANFSKAFREHFGMSPSAMRAEYQQNRDDQVISLDPMRFVA